MNGATEKFDVDSNGIFDLAVKVVRILGAQATLELKGIADVIPKAAPIVPVAPALAVKTESPVKAPESAPQPAVESAPAPSVAAEPAAQEPRGMSGLLIGAILVGLVGLGGVAWYVFSGKKGPRSFGF